VAGKASKAGKKTTKPAAAKASDKALASAGGATLLGSLVSLAQRLPITEKDLLAGIAKLGDVNAVDPRTGLTLLLAQVASPSEAVVKALLARGADPGRGNEESGVEIPLAAAKAFKQPVTPMLKVGRGDTPLAVLRRARRQVDRAGAAFGRLKRPSSPTDAFYFDGHKKKLEAWLAAYPAVEALLAGTGAAADEAARTPQPPFKAAIDARVLRLGRKLGADLADLERQLAAEDASDLGPFRTFKQGIAVLRGLVAIELDAKAKEASVLARILADEAFSTDPPRSFAAYPKEAQKPLREGRLLASSDADLWVAYPVGDGFQVAHAHPEQFRVLARSIETFLDDELSLLGA